MTVPPIDISNVINLLNVQGNDLWFRVIVDLQTRMSMRVIGQATGTSAPTICRIKCGAQSPDVMPGLKLLELHRAEGFALICFSNETREVGQSGAREPNGAQQGNALTC